MSGSGTTRAAGLSGDDHSRSPVASEREEPWTYSDWVELLGANFFSRKRTGMPVTLFIDDDELARLSALPKEEAAKSLVRATSGILGPLTSRDAYRTVLKITSAWERSGSEGYIRCLPLLAIAVLAGSRMAADGVIRKTNYYKRFWALVGESGEGQPTGYELMPEVWGAYTRWLNDTQQGGLGISTAAAHPAYTYIGYALSQALFRSSDRHELTYFLDSLGGPVTDGMPSSQLVALIRTWAASRGRFSAGARLLISDTAYEHQLDLLFRDAANSWDGSVLDELGQRESRVLLHWNFEDGEALSTLAERPEGFPGSIGIGTAGQALTLTAAGGTRFYREPPYPIDAELLTIGRRTRSGRYSFRFSGQAIHLFADSDEIPGWISTRRLAWNRPHVVIAEAAFAEQLRALFDQAGESGWSGPRAYPSLPAGYVAFRSVVPRYEAAESWAGTPLGPLLPVTGAPASLVNGLRLERARLYLVGGEPDLLCPLESYTLDRQTHGATPGSIVKLRHRGLGPGRHTIRVGEQTIRFALVAGGANPAMTPEGRVQLVIGPGVALSGAAVPGPWARRRFRVLLRYGYQHVVLGARPGQIWKPVRRALPPRMARVLYSPLAEAEIPFQPVWLFAIDRAKRKSVRLLVQLPPEPSNDNPGVAERTWARFFLHESAGAPNLWQEYRAAAVQLLEHHEPG